MNDRKDTLHPKHFQIGDIIFFQENDWKVAEIQGTQITLFRDRIDGQAETMKIESDELRNKLMQR